MEEKTKCKICERECRTLINLQQHISKTHKEINSEKYYNQFIIEDPTLSFECPIHQKSCKGKKSFINLSLGYSNTCNSKGCAAEYGMLKKYGVKNCSSLDLVKQQKVQTTLKNYGVENPFQSNIIKKQCIESVEKKYGVKHISKSDVIKRRKIQTTLKNYGVEYPAQSKVVQDRMKTTVLDKYGVKNIFQHSSFKERVKQTWYKKYGVDNPSKSKIIQNKKFEKYCKNKVPQILSLIDSLGFELLSKYKSALEPIKLRCKKCKTEFESTWFGVQQSFGYCCPNCHHSKVCSIGEIEVAEFTESLEVKISKNNRKIVCPLELDIVVEDKKLAIEYCGLYWHGNVWKDRNYHLSKLHRCEEKGYKLITIFEDEWLLKQDIVKARLKHILGVDTDTIKVRASACEIKEIDSKVKNEFLTQYHIQGKDNSSVKLGAYYNTELVAVMTFSKGSLAKGVKSQVQGVWELNRFCSNSSYHVYGIASKFLQYFKTNYDWSQIYSYADRRWSDGNLYKQLGFELVSKTEPNYWYWGNNIVGKAHRFNYRKSNLKHMSNYDPSLTEFQIMALEGYGWIYDCGNLKFKLDN